MQYKRIPKEVLEGLTYDVAAPAHNTSGVKGLSWSNIRNLWVGQVKANGRSHKIRNASREVVEAWLVEKRRELHGGFARD